jgi:hypothetical protein
MPPIHVRKNASSTPAPTAVGSARSQAATPARPACQLTAIPLSVAQRVPLASALPTAGVVQLWHAVHGQEGEFEGDESAHHLHRVGGDEHYRYGSVERVNYIRVGVPTKYDHVARAIEVCDAAGPSKSGQYACLIYLRDLLSRLERPAPIIPEEKKEPPKKDPPPRKPLSKKAQALEDRGNKLQAEDPFGF